MDRLVRASHADVSSTRHVYDEDGDLTSKTDNDPGGYTCNRARPGG